MRQNTSRLNYKVSRGFTLIELLVVISIIALLISIIVPALSRARSLAARVICQSNIKQMILGQMNYASSNKGNFPPHYTQYPAWVKEAQSMPIHLRQHNVVDRLQDYIEGTMTICPIYANRAGDPVLAWPDAFGPVRDQRSNWGAWNSGAPNIYLSYMWFTNWTGYGDVRLNSELEFARGETPWPNKQTDCSSRAAMIAHRAEARLLDWGTGEVEGVPERGHGGMTSPGTYETPVGYGDGSVSINLRSSIRPRARIAAWPNSAIIY